MKKERGYYGKERIYKDVDTGFCHWYNYSYTYCGYEKYRGRNICKNGFKIYTGKYMSYDGSTFLFFALKSLTVILPLSALYLASGILFSPFMALFVSTCGLAITLTIPYLIGYFSGKKVVQSIQERYPKAQKIMEYQRENTFFACFITRIVGVLPGDIVSLYFGACNTRYDIYLIAGIAGSLLSIITTTILGEKISHPFSIGFFVVLLCRVLVSSGSIFTNYILNKRKEEDF